MCCEQVKFILFTCVSVKVLIQNIALVMGLRNLLPTLPHTYMHARTVIFRHDIIIEPQ